MLALSGPEQRSTVLSCGSFELPSRSLTHAPVQKTPEQTARENIMWGLNIDALKHYEVKPTKLCENTTFQHFACTISHMLLVYQAYMANEVSPRCSAYLPVPDRQSYGQQSACSSLVAPCMLPPPLLQLTAIQLGLPLTIQQGSSAVCNECHVC